MATIKTDFGEGGQQLTPAGGTKEPTLAGALRDGADDFETLRAQFNALLTKIDLEGTLAGDYVTSLELASGDILTKKG